ncbi:transcriptional repressor [Marinospirillum sp. MEB164]|uniref:Ferric uptake regulation protein n=1 Tax=Marinospirillum alkalitolerans TaxID=3123374 RepID=A0ABW8PWY0_9GAMM
MNLTHDILAQADALCARKGVRLTPTRRRVLEMIAQSQGGAKAYDLLDSLTAENASARPPTIYRAIDFLMSHGLIHRIESLNAYVSCICPEHHQAYQLLICRQCGEVIELHEESLDTQLNEAARLQGFCVEKKTIEVHGLCQNCQTGQPAAETAQA